MLHYFYMTATKQYYSVKEVADLLGISRVTVFRWVKTEKVKATMLGGSYVIANEDLPHHLLGGASESSKQEIRKAVKLALDDYGEAFIALASE